MSPGPGVEPRLLNSKKLIDTIKGKNA